MLGHRVPVYVPQFVVRSFEQLGRRGELLVPDRLVPDAFALRGTESAPGSNAAPGRMPDEHTTSTSGDRRGAAGGFAGGAERALHPVRRNRVRPMSVSAR